MSRTLVVITCKRDQWNFELLCKSLEKFVDPCKIIFIYNESAEDFKYWQKVFYRHRCMPHLGKFDITLMYKDQFWTLDDENHLTNMEKCGWTGQQVIKLAVSKFVQTDFYLVLDAKNFFIDHTSIDNIRHIKPEPTDWCEPILKNWIVTCFETFDLLPPEKPVRLTQNTTPYIVRTESAKSLVDLFGGSNFLYKWFTLEARKEKHSPSEFFLYEIFTMRYGHRNLGDTQQNCIAFWEHMHTIQRWKPRDYFHFIEMQKNLHNVKVAGIHGGMKPIWTNGFAIEILNKLNCGDIIPEDLPFKKDKIFAKY